MMVGAAGTSILIRVNQMECEPRNMSAAVRRNRDFLRRSGQRNYPIPFGDQRLRPASRACGLPTGAMHV